MVFLAQSQGRWALGAAGPKNKWALFRLTQYQRNTIFNIVLLLMDKS